jgi:F-type H+-transporting ATPase subunit b
MLASNFLVPNATIFVEALAFLIVLFIIGRYILPFVNTQLEERQGQIQESLDAAETAKAEADETRAERQIILTEAREQAREIVATATATAERVRSEAEERAQREYDRLVSSAQADIALARQRAVDEVSAGIGALVVSVARQVIGREIDADQHRDLIDEAIAALRSSASSTAGTQA